MVDVFLAIALLCFIVPWVLQTRDTVRAGKNHMNPNFALLYVVGYLLLAYYALLNSDLLIVGLVGVAAILAMVNFAYTLAAFWQGAGAGRRPKRKRR